MFSAFVLHIVMLKMEDKLEQSFGLTVLWSSLVFSSKSISSEILLNSLLPPPQAIQKTFYSPLIDHNVIPYSKTFI